MAMKKTTTKKSATKKTATKKTTKKAQAKKEIKKEATWTDAAKLVLGFLAEQGYENSECPDVDKYDGGDVCISFGEREGKDWDDAESFVKGVIDDISMWAGNYDALEEYRYFGDQCKALEEVWGDTPAEFIDSFNKNVNKAQIDKLIGDLFRARGVVENIEYDLRKLGVDPAAV